MREPFSIMKYNISINQYAAVKYGFDLDIIDLAIFECIKDISHSPKCVKIQTPEGVFFWVSHKLVMKELPLLKIKTPQGLSRRIENLIKAELLIKHPDCDKYSKTLYSFGDKCDLLSFKYTLDEENEFSTPQQNFGVARNESLETPRNESLGYNNINNNNNTRDNKKSLLVELDITPEGIKVDKKVCDKINKLLLDVTFPFDDKATKRKFFILCCMPNWRTKTIHAVQMQLSKLAKYDLGFINQLIDNSIMNGWQGLVYKDTDEQYERWKKQQAGTQFKQIENPEEKQAMLDYLNENW